MKNTSTRRKDPLAAITETTEKLWECVNEKYGPHVYTLGVNGIGEVVLCERYMDVIAHGTNRDVQKVLRRLLAEEVAV